MSQRAEITVVGDYLWDKTYTRSVDQITSGQFLIPAVVLMEVAGRGVAEAVLEAGVEDSPIIVLAGPGNNGGDALVTARWLHEAGCTVYVFAVGPEAGKAVTPLNQAQRATLAAVGLQTPAWKPGALTRFAKAEPIIIDGVLGLGAHGGLDEDSLAFQALSEAATLGDRTVVAIDVPSGLDSDSGAAQSVPLPADVTITFGGRKPAHVVAPARDACGEIFCLDIGFPAGAQEAALAVHRPPLVAPDPRELLRIDPWSELKRSAHKYDRGHVLVIGGSAGKTGAPLLSALGALRAGAGWVSVAMPDSASATLKGDVPREVVFEPLFDGERLNAIKLESFLEERKVKAVVVGPGSVQNPLTAEVLAALATFTGEQDGFVLLDAGATHGVAPLLTGLTLDPASWVLTPHPGEWQKLGAGVDAEPLTPAGFKQVAALAERLGVALLYKHATPVLITGNPKTPGFVISEGTNALARAGSGDVLAGVAGAHGAMGLNAAVATLRAQVQVAWAADLAAELRGKQAVLARDIIDQLGNVTKNLDADDE